MTDGATLTISERFEVIYCCNCRCSFAVPASIRARWLGEGSRFYCPNGHSQAYTESELDRVKKKLSHEKRLREWAEHNTAEARKERDHAAAQARGYKGAMVKVKKRVGRGVCPCCTRTFSNLAAHMATKHPEYAEAPPPTTDKEE